MTRAKSTKPSATKPTTRARKPGAATKAAPATKAKPATKARPATKAKPATKPAARADLGAPIDGFFRKQGPVTRPILEALRLLVEQTVPDATSSLKWGMPFYTIDGNIVCALGGHKAHVNLILSGPPGTYADPDGRLVGDGKTGRHLKLTALDQIPRDAVKGWLRTAADLARK